LDQDSLVVEVSKSGMPLEGFFYLCRNQSSHISITAIYSHVIYEPSNLICKTSAARNENMTLER
jgi:hypothetical protein